jgi:hypothetical protein
MISCGGWGAETGGIIRQDRAEKVQIGKKWLLNVSVGHCDLQACVDPPL